MRKTAFNILNIFILLIIIVSVGNNALAQGNDSTEYYYKKYGWCWFGKVSKETADEQQKETSYIILHKTDDEDVDDGRTYIIPVVFHIIHNNGNENIPDEYIHRQIEDLNRDFRTPGTYLNQPAGVDTKIRFCLAKVDPQGNPSTGILRFRSEEHTTLNSNAQNEIRAKNLSRWDPKRYLNFWIVRNIDGNDSIAGYSYLPTEVAGSQQDGVVLNFRFVGSNNRFRPNFYSLGKTATHEVGHYLNLLHTWGRDGDNRGGCNDDDGVHDTPLCDRPYFARPPCREISQCNFQRMIQNHMDYSLEVCSTVFTKGQADRMRKALRTYRPTLISYPNILLINCDSTYNTLNPVTENKLEIHPNPAASPINIYPRFKEKKQLHISIYDNMGRHIKDINNIEAVTDQIQVYLPELSPGLYHLFIRTDEEIFQKKLILLERK